MSPKKGPSRSEMNREIRRILVKNGVDTSKLQYTCSGRTLTITGSLYKDGGASLLAPNISIIFQEFNKLGLQIYCDLENWLISEGAITPKGEALEKKKVVKPPENKPAASKAAA